MLPLVTLSIPPSKLSSVDLPAPLGPSITTNSPFGILKFILFNALNVFSPILYDLTTSLKTIKSFKRLIKKNTKLVVSTHGSNVFYLLTQTFYK